MLGNRKVSTGLILVLIYCVASAGLLFIPRQIAPHVVVLSNVTSSQGANETLTIEYQITSGLYSMNSVSTVLALGDKLNFTRIAVFFDTDYPTLTTQKRIAGLTLHLESKLEEMALQIDVDIVNADGFLAVITDAETDVLVVVPTSIFPANVFSNETNLITQWLQKGGRLVWVGLAFAWYYAYENDPGPRTTSSQGQERILGYCIVEGHETYGSTISSPLMTALGLRWTKSEFGPNIDWLVKNNCTVLGAVSGENSTRTSIAYCPVGAGGVIIFGNRISGPGSHYPERTVAYDIAQLISANAMSSVLAFSYNTHRLSRLTYVRSSLECTYPFEISLLLFFVHSPDPFYHGFKALHWL